MLVTAVPGQAAVHGVAQDQPPAAGASPAPLDYYHWYSDTDVYAHPTIAREGDAIRLNASVTCHEPYGVSAPVTPASPAPTTTASPAPVASASPAPTTTASPAPAGAAPASYGDEVRPDDGSVQFYANDHLVGSSHVHDGQAVSYIWLDEGVYKVSGHYTGGHLFDDVYCEGSWGDPIVVVLPRHEGHGDNHNNNHVRVSVHVNVNPRFHIVVSPHTSIRLSQRTSVHVSQRNSQRTKVVVIGGEHHHHGHHHHHHHHMGMMAVSGAMIRESKVLPVTG